MVRVKTLLSLTHIMLNIKWLPPKTTPIYFPCQLFWQPEHGSDSVHTLIAPTQNTGYSSIILSYCEKDILQESCLLVCKGWLYSFSL